MLDKSKLIPHQLYFYQSKFGCQWLMPINESVGYDGVYVDVLVCVDRREIENLPKHDNIRGYMVSREIKGSVYRKPEIVWELPKDKRGQELFYKHYRLKSDFLLSSILIPIDVLEKEYPELISISGQFCLGLTPKKEKSFRRELLIKELLHE